LNPAPSITADVALFLDIDGTLVEFEDDPASVRVDATLLRALEAWSAHLQGALALVSGRAIAQIDACIAQNRFPVAGLHGLERRDASGTLYREPVGPELRRAASRLREVLADERAVRLEDKGSALAIHFRKAPERVESLYQVARALVAELGPDFRLLEGADVIELLPRSANKGAAVRAFMSAAPFRGRRPVFVGDDITDLDGIRAAQELGGYGVAVGGRVAADYQLDGVNAVRRWLGAAS
jgi:trehalose 6-phosphate phosphatase